MSAVNKKSSRETKATKSKDKGKKSKLRDEEEEEEEEAEIDPNSGLAYGEDDEFYKKWAGPVLVGPFIPAILSMFIIVAGQLVLNNWTGTCGYDLESYVSAQIATCYLFLLVFSWVYMGEEMSLQIKWLDIDMVVLRPFKSMKWIMYSYLGLFVMNFIIGIYGSFIMSLAVFCAPTAPMLYKFSLFILAISWIFFFTMVAYCVKFFLGNRIAAFIQEQTRTETMEEVEERIFRKKFNLFDPEKEDKVKREDFPKILQELGVFVPDEEISTLADTFDPEQSGYIPYQPFYDWFKDMNKKADDQINSLQNKGDDSDDD